MGTNLDPSVDFYLPQAFGQNNLLYFTIHMQPNLFLFTRPKLCGPRHVVGSKQSEQQLKKVKRCAGAFSNHNTFPDRGSLDRRSPDGGSPDQGSQDWESSDQESLDRPRGELSLDHMTIKACTTIILGRVWTKASL